MAITDSAGPVVVDSRAIEELLVGDPCSGGDEVLEMNTTDEGSP